MENIAVNGVRRFAFSHPTTHALRVYAFSHPTTDPFDLTPLIRAESERLKQWYSSVQAYNKGEFNYQNIEA